LERSKIRLEERKVNHAIADRELTQRHIVLRQAERSVSNSARPFGTRSGRLTLGVSDVSARFAAKRHVIG
jgi:hypothetical protein